jgi:hypothetical protein
MERKFEARKALRYTAIGMVAVAGLLIAAAWFRPTPVLAPAAAEHPDCLTPAQD